MGMSGNYFRTSESTVEKIRRGEIALSDLIYDKAEKEHIVDIDKAWHAIQFTLTGASYGGDDDNIFSRLVLSGNTLLEEDDDEFSSMLMAVPDVKALAAALALLTQEDFRERFNVQEMLENQIYPVTEDDDEEDFFEYVWDAVEELKEFFDDAAREGQAVIFYVM
ncbi:YfbM family protein [Mailhella massiliensis]|uniref:YfbM family protein n=1 Tax=Mailhella massiliensis TaxID=1903261 RepID=A0A921DQ51_9BACT|nr:YfbM family protein [Mailhella massiliensis]HJD96095.1 YfbM family protein [Mailhella massiliensis]